MAFGATCDRCGCDLLGLDLRYKVSLEIAQAYDPMEISSKDLRRDLRGELEALLENMKALPAAEVKNIEEEVFSAFCFDFCPKCAQRLREDAKSFLSAERESSRLHGIAPPPDEPAN